VENKKYSRDGKNISLNYSMKILKKTQECEEIHSAFQLISTPNEKEVLRATDKLRNNKAPGPDMIPAELLKVHEKELIKRLHNIMKAAWETDYLTHGRYQ